MTASRSRGQWEGTTLQRLRYGDLWRLHPDHGPCAPMQLIQFNAVTLLLSVRYKGEVVAMGGTGDPDGCLDPENEGAGAPVRLELVMSDPDERARRTADIAGDVAAIAPTREEVRRSIEALTIRLARRFPVGSRLCGGRITRAEMILDAGLGEVCYRIRTEPHGGAFEARTVTEPEVWEWRAEESP